MCDEMATCRRCGAGVPRTGRKGRPRVWCEGCAALPYRARISLDKLEQERKYQREYKRWKRGYKGGPYEREVRG